MNVAVVSYSLSWIKGECLDCKKEGQEEGRKGEAGEVKASVYVGDIFLEKSCMQGSMYLE